MSTGPENKSGQPNLDNETARALITDAFSDFPPELQEKLIKRMRQRERLQATAEEIKDRAKIVKDKDKQRMMRDAARLDREDADNQLSDARWALNRFERRRRATNVVKAGLRQIRVLIYKF